MSSIFDGVYFAIILSEKLDSAQAAQLSETLENHGATCLPLTSSPAELHQITHIISSHVDFPAYHDALIGLINVVKPAWVKDSVIKKKTALARQYSPDPQFFFSEVNLVCADDIPEGDKDAIIGGVQAMGGHYSSFMTKTVTHIVAQSISNPQCQTAINKKLASISVLPHWFDVCLKLGKKIDCGPYVIPETGPPPIHQGRVENFAPKHEWSGTSHLAPSQDELPQISTPPVSPSKGRRELSVFTNKRVMLHDDLNLSDHLKVSLKTIITSGGGRVVDDLVEATALICHYRESTQFMDAYRAGKEVGNLNWLYHLIQRNRWTAPTDRLLHFPYPLNGIEGFEYFKISISNYSGDARMYLESLVAAAKGKFTRTLTQENTHLITAHPNSEKCEAAREWNVHIVNHCWLEESYARGKLESVSNPRYTTFPERTNLAEVVGQEHIDRDSLAHEHGFERTAASSPEEPSPSKRGRYDRDEPVDTSYRTPAANGGKKRRNTQTPAERLGAQPDTPGSRGAKDRALSKLRDQAGDIALYNRESKRVGGVIYGGRRVTDPDRITLDVNSRHAPHKRSISEATSEDVSVAGTDDEQVSHAPRKKTKNTKAAGKSNDPPLKVLLTHIDGADRFLSSMKLKSLNLKFTGDTLPKPDVIVAPKLVRTHKFLCGIAAAPIAVVRVDWLEAMMKEGVRLPLEDYTLDDRTNEGETDYKLEDIVERARANKEKGGMLKGWTLFATENVRGGFETYRDIIAANGGVCLLFKGRLTKIARTSRAPMKQSDANANGNEVNVDREKDNAGTNGTQISGSEKENGDAETRTAYLVTDTEDKGLWPKFKSMAADQGFKCMMVKPDWILRIAMGQDINEWTPAFNFEADA